MTPRPHTIVVSRSESQESTQASVPTAKAHGTNPTLQLPVEWGEL